MERGPVLGVGAVIVGEGGRVVIIQRGKAPNAGRWTLPGGAVEWGEGLTDAVVREVAEETGLEVEVLGLVEVVELRGEGHHYVVLDYLCAARGGALRAGSDAADACWVGEGELAGVELIGETAAVIGRGLVLWRSLFTVD